MRDTCSSEAVESLQRRQAMTTWGILGLAVFVSVGMAEWSKRQAAGETVIDPAVMEQAVKMAAAAAANVNVKVNVDESGVRNSKFEIRNSKSENNLSDLSISAVNYSATAEAQRRGVQATLGVGK
jgi:hypothetical protein